MPRHSDDVTCYSLASKLQLGRLDMNSFYFDAVCRELMLYVVENIDIKTTITGGSISLNISETAQFYASLRRRQSHQTVKLKHAINSIV